MVELEKTMIETAKPRVLTESRLKWGVVKMPDELYAGCEDENCKPGTVGYLRFGSKEDDVQDAVEHGVYV